MKKVKPMEFYAITSTGHRKETAMRKSISVTLVLILGIFLGILTSKWVSPATAEEKAQRPTLFQYIGTHSEGSNSLINVYCDRDRRNLIYSYIVAVDNSASSNLVVLKDACK